MLLPWAGPDEGLIPKGTLHTPETLLGIALTAQTPSDVSSFSQMKAFGSRHDTTPTNPKRGAAGVVGGA